MAEYPSPAVGIAETKDVRPIQGAPTSTAAFLGETERGPLAARLVTSYPESVRWFGGPFSADTFMPPAVSL